MNTTEYHRECVLLVFLHTYLPKDYIKALYVCDFKDQLKTVVTYDGSVIFLQQ